MRLNVCFNEMVPFGPFPSSITKGKTPFDSDGSKGGLPMKQDVDPLGTNVFLIDKHGFTEGLVSFYKLCCV